MDSIELPSGTSLDEEQEQETTNRAIFISFA